MRHGRKRSPFRFAVQGLALAGLLGAAVGFSATGKTVTITVDGQSRVVRTFASDVAQVLSRAGVAVGAHDVVAPAPGTHLHDGALIVVARGRPLTLVVDGVERTIWVTQETVGQAVQALGLRLDGAYVSASRSGRIPLDGTTVLVQLPQRITLIADGRRRVVESHEVTVADLLAAQNVSLGGLDRVSVPLGAYPTDGLVVRVARVHLGATHVVRWIRYATRRVADSSMYTGNDRLVQTGRRGRIDRWYRLTYVDGKLTGKKLVRSLRRAPQPRIVAYGTKQRPLPVVHTYSPSPDGLNWQAVAMCESGGDPSIVDPPYYGLYQFTIGTWESVGGTGLPSNASASEQTYRAQLLYRRDGAAPWPVCGKYL